MVAGLTWMIFTRLGNPNANLITFAAGFIFLAFFSARMVLQYFRNDIVLSILPTGICDTRWGRGLIEWEKIKEVTLLQRESEFEINIHLWPVAQKAEILPIDLNALESNVETVINALAVHIQVRTEF